MTGPIRLHWSRSKPNFGDWLSPALCEVLSGRRVEYAPAERADLFAVGSLFDRIPRRWLGRRVDVWGTGSIAPGKPRRSRHRYHALRGPLTAGLLLGQEVAALGDPGLLAELLLPPQPVAKRHTLGIVPHYKDAGLPAVAELAGHFPSSLVIDVFESPELVISRIRSCHYVVSSSLHGIVVAHGLGIPAAWMELSDAVRGGGWKFRDHYAALGQEAPAPLTCRELLDADIDSLFSGIPAPPVADCKAALLASFPFPR